MQRERWLIATVTVAMATAAVACKGGPSEKKDEGSATEREKKAAEAEEADGPSAEIPDRRLEAFEPLPDEMTSEDNPITEEKVALGRRLYYDERFSRKHDVSCNTCHKLKEYGVDHLKTSRGTKDQVGPRNSPTVYNAAGHFRQFWDGRAEDVEEQATMPIVTGHEHGMPDEKTVEKVLKSIPGYVEWFDKAFPDQESPVTMENFGKAVGAFERKLTTPSPWDAYLEGDEDALSTKQKKGFNAFHDAGCIACHSGGPYVGGQSFRKVGLVEEWPNKDDLGRYDVTEKESDRMKFKVPSLRNVAKTGPYFHSGRIEDLSKAVELMAKHQLGKDLSDERIELIVAWLESLTGELPDDELIAKPELPESGPETPKPGDLPPLENPKPTDGDDE